MPAAACCFRPATRTWKNSSMLRGEDRQELRPLQQRHAGVLGQRQHAGVEVDRRQLAVEVPVLDRGLAWWPTPVRVDVPHRVQSKHASRCRRAIAGRRALGRARMPAHHPRASVSTGSGSADGAPRLHERGPALPAVDGAAAVQRPACRALARPRRCAPSAAAARPLPARRRPAAARPPPAPARRGGSGRGSPSRRSGRRGPTGARPAAPPAARAWRQVQRPTARRSAGHRSTLIRSPPLVPAAGLLVVLGRRLARQLGRVGQLLRLLLVLARARGS